MAEVDIEKKGGKKGKNGKWWAWVIVAIVALLIAWMALSDRNNVDEEEPELDTALAEVIVPQSQNYNLKMIYKWT